MRNLGLPDLDKKLSKSLVSELRLVEKRLDQAIKGNYPFAVETSRHLIGAGGKRVRPLLTLLASHFGKSREKNLSQIVDAAVVCELTHVATLYHDDVMDDAPKRRGVPSANNRWGNTVAILTGDYIFAKTSLILADLGPEAVRLQAKTFERLVVGQINETLASENSKYDLDLYLKIIADKTASLLSTSARFGAMFAGANENITNTLAKYGEEMGLVFQLADDLIDIESSSAKSGKTPGTDLREGVPTLVTLLILTGKIPATKSLKKQLSGPITNEKELKEVLKQLRNHEALAAANKIVNQHAQKAIKYLSDLPNGVAKEALILLTESIVNRSA